MVKVEVRTIKKLGLEVWQVLVGGSVHTECLNEDYARAKAARLKHSLGGSSDEDKK